MISQAEFARQQGWSRSYVTQLKKDGRLVMVADGKRMKVDVDASLKRIKATEDPNREDVRQRHAAEREDVVDPVAAKAGISYQNARAVKERFNALSAKLAYEKESGTVVEAAEVKKAGFELGTHIRTALENLPDQLAPELAPISDPARVHAVLVEYFETLLTDVSNQLANVAEVNNDCV